jgi:hypothetical protein
MRPNDDGGDVWFAAQRYGYGAGRPISWQGWAMLAGYVLLIAVAGLLATYSWIAVIGIVLAATAAFILVCAQRTRGGWRWRWGEKE